MHWTLIFTLTIIYQGQWKAEFDCYIKTLETVLQDTDIVDWWVCDQNFEFILLMMRWLMRLMEFFGIGFYLTMILI